MKAWVLSLMIGVSTLLPQLSHAEFLNHEEDCCRECCGLYVGAMAGATFWEDLNMEGTLPSGSNFRYSFEAGWAAGARIGYDMGCCGLKFEVEGAYQKVEVDSVRFSTTDAPGNGDMSIFSFFGNLRYQSPCEPCKLCFSPIFGFGIGAAHVSINDRSFPGTVIDDDDTVFAYQVILGIAVNFCECGDFTVEYHSLNTDKLGFTPTTPSGTTLGGAGWLHTHQMVVSFNYTLL